MRSSAQNSRVVQSVSDACETRRFSTPEPDCIYLRRFSLALTMGCEFDSHARKYHRITKGSHAHKQSNTHVPRTTNEYNHQKMHLSWMKLGIRDGSNRLSHIFLYTCIACLHWVMSPLSLCPKTDAILLHLRVIRSLWDLFASERLSNMRKRKRHPSKRECTPKPCSIRILSTSSHETLLAFSGYCRSSMWK